MDLVGRKLGKYEILERIGQGGMAAVYKAFQPGVERHVAIKVMLGHLADSDDFVQRFRREAQSVGQLTHANIVRVIDFDVESDLYYMVMDFIQGGTLGDYLKSKEKLDPDDALEVVAQLADGLAYAHNRGMVHRDIKPGNVMFIEQAPDCPIIMDFGIARLLDESGVGLTMTGAMVGTPNYMSPEAARGEEADERADVYSLGVVLYELVTGRTPYIADTPYGVIMKQANDPLPLPTELNSDIPVAVEELLIHALEKDVNDRYQSAADFAAAIRETQTALANGTANTTSAKTRSTKTRATKGGTRMSANGASGKANSNGNNGNNRSWLPLALAGGGVALIAILTVVALMMFGQTDNGSGDPSLAVDNAASDSAASDSVDGTPESTATNAPEPTAEPTAEPTVEAVAADAEDTEAEDDSTDEATADEATADETTADEATADETTADNEGVIEGDASDEEPAPAADVEETAVTDTDDVEPMMRSLGTLRFVDNDSASSGDFVLSLDQMMMPPIGSEYELWLTNDGDELNLGAIDVADGRVAQTGSTDQNLLLDYNQAEIRMTGSDEPTMISQIDPALTDVLSTFFVADAEIGKTALEGANQQLNIAIQHMGMAQDALADGNLSNVYRHMEHVVNVLVGEEGEFFGDMTGDGMAQNPGDGVGVQWYLQELQDATSKAVMNAQNTQPMLEDIAAIIDNSVDNIDEAVDIALQVFASDTTEEAQPFVNDLDALLMTVFVGGIEGDTQEPSMADVSDAAAQLATYEFVMSVDTGDELAGIEMTATEMAAMETVGSAMEQVQGQTVGHVRFADVVQEVTQGESYGEFGPQSDDSGSESSADTGEYGAGEYGGEYSGEYSAADTYAQQTTIQRLRTSQLVMNLDDSGLTEPPADMRYEVWLTADDGRSEPLNVGELTAEDISANTSTYDSVQHLLLDYDQVICTVQADDNENSALGEPVFAISYTSELFTTLRQLLFGETPTGTPPTNTRDIEGLVAAENQVTVALDHYRFVQDALEQGNIEEARRHTEHVINVLDGKTGQFYGDLDGDNIPQNPGNGVGVRVYLDDAVEQLTAMTDLLTTGTIVPTPNRVFYMDRAIAAHDNSVELNQEATERALQVFAADTLEEMQPFVDELGDALAALVNGTDVDGSGVVDPVEGEGGMLALYDYALLLAEQPIVVE
ncbi:MAG: protein kinase [Chloroflexota bacterium]